MLELSEHRKIISLVVDIASRTAIGQGCARPAGIMECETATHELEVCNFVDNVKNFKFISGDKIVHRLHGSELTRDYFERTAFSSPVLVEQPEGLGIVVPPNITASDIERFIGPTREFDILDVASQTEICMTLMEWIKYFQSQDRKRVLNALSLEYTDTELEKLITAPTAVREMDWLRLYWPKDLPDDPCYQKPKFGKYCLMSTKGSFTDFHFDVAGTSVWHYVYSGEKFFYLIPPTNGNIDKLFSWFSRKNFSFLSDLVPECYVVHLTAGNSLFMPTGWIHAVYTPQDSIIFQDNFLQRYSIGLQIRLRVGKINDYRISYHYPAEVVTWYAAQGLLKEFTEHWSNSTVPPKYLLEGVKEMIPYLKDWIATKEDLKVHLNLASPSQTLECVIDKFSEYLRQWISPV
ncbi:hypothetical protein EMCRGX_G014770 [Ephydatia muelleri]